MKNHSKEEIVEKTKSFKNDFKKIKEYVNDLYYVNFGSNSSGKREEYGEYFVEKNDFKEEFEYNYKYTKENKELYKDTISYKVKVDCDFKDIEKFLTEIEENKNHSSLGARLNNEIIGDSEKINNALKNFNGSFMITQNIDTVKSTVYDYDNPKGMENFEFPVEELNPTKTKGIECKSFLNTLESLLNKEQTDENKIKFSADMLKTLLNNNDKTVLYINSDNIKENSLTIRKDDKELVLSGEEINFGRLTNIKGYNNILFDIEQEKVQDYLVKPYEIEQSIDNLSRKMFYGSSGIKEIRDDIIRTIFNDDDLIEKTNHFTKNTENLKDIMRDKFEDVFEGLGEEFTEKYMERKAGLMGLNMKNHKIVEVLEMGSPDEYTKNLMELTKEMYMKEVEYFDKQISKGDIEKNFTELQRKDTNHNYVKILDKAYENIYKYLDDEKNKDTLGEPSKLSYHQLAKSVGLNVSPYSDKVDKLKEKFSGETTSEIKKNISNEFEKSTQKEKEMEI